MGWFNPQDIKLKIMDIKGCRIGNIVDVLGESMVILGISNRLRPDCGYYEFDGLIPLKGIHVKGVGLSAEWLERFGWKKHSIREVWLGDRYDIIWNGKVFNLELSEHSSITIRWVHQLQNLFYALCGEEMVLDSPPEGKLEK